MKCKDCWSIIQIPWYCRSCEKIEEFKHRPVASPVKSKEPTKYKRGYWQKESDNKLSYELDRYFIEAMAKRMEQNKGKYPPYNRQKPMDIESLKQALLRHTIEVMKGNYTDIEEYDHLSAIACNAQFIYYQLKNHDLQKM